MITIDLQRKMLGGNHLTLLLGPAGREEWGLAFKDGLGGILGSGGDKVTMLRAIDKVIEELVAWSQDGSLYIIMQYFYCNKSKINRK